MYEAGMDIIQRAIEKKQHVSKRIEINQQNWSDFKENANNKKIFIKKACQAKR